MASGDAAQLSDVGTYIGNILTAAIPLIGIISFVMILVGGFTYLTAGGNPEGAKKGQAILTAAIVGLVMSILAWLILLFIQNVTGAQVTNFQFGL